MFFGYTQCPDVCPTSMAELAEVKKLLGKDGERLQGLFVTVDPERDTPEVLKAYMANFDPDLSGALHHARKTGLSWPKTTRCTTKKWMAKRPPATPWTIRPAAMCMTRRASCACSPAMAVGLKSWFLIFAC